MSRFLSILIGLPLSIIILALAVANRRMVTVSFDPFSATDPSLAVQVPLFAVVFAALIIGVVLGGGVTWLRQSRYRREAREARREARKEEVRKAEEKREANAAAVAALSLPTPPR
ncbi:lipopolysaccharide assembly protein LapA domain-containing protein [Xanthobacter sp. TB0139]|uniref:lipopolysaccharide assembly protein LapA domain-containing protein n=1 Tax=Xanthobacter sp. TB0139 TaxID=3459178 RepID=UPI0040391EE3